jgi:hypothetical protein
MNSNIYDHINQEMKYFEICLDMAKRHVEDILLTLAVVDDQHLSAGDLDAVNMRYFQELNQQLGRIFVEMEAWEQVPQVSHLENDASGY